uniref:BolA-like protein 3 n=1 Tax=Graphocephala atropunctata TaxID=36148 RepID=A0A1B6LRB3_9HEMI
MYTFRTFSALRNCLSKELLAKRPQLFQIYNLLSDQTGKPIQTVPVESNIQDILRKNFPSAEYIEVRDVSGGCGAMFEISVITEEFRGLTIVKQHRLINEALKEEIKDMHGLRIHTALPSKSN